MSFVLVLKCTSQMIVQEPWCLSAHSLKDNVYVLDRKVLKLTKDRKVVKLGPVSVEPLLSLHVTCHL